MKRIIAVAFAAAAITAGTIVAAHADPAPGGNNPAYVCAPGQTPADPPPCPGNDK